MLHTKHELVGSIGTTHVSSVNFRQAVHLMCRGVSRIFEWGGGGGSNSSWFPKKRSSYFKRGVQWSDGGVQYISLTIGRQILHIWMLKNELTCTLTIKKQFTLHLSVRSGWVGAGGVTDEKGGAGKGGSGPPEQPPLWTRL